MSLTPVLTPSQENAIRLYVGLFHTEYPYLRSSLDRETGELALWLTTSQRTELTLWVRGYNLDVLLMQYFDGCKIIEAAEKAIRRRKRIMLSEDRISKRERVRVR